VTDCAWVPLQTAARQFAVISWSFYVVSATNGNAFATKWLNTKSSKLT